MLAYKVGSSEDRAGMRRGGGQVEQDLLLDKDGNVFGKKIISFDRSSARQVVPGDGVMSHPDAAQQGLRCELDLVMTRKLGDDKSM